MVQNTDYHTVTPLTPVTGLLTTDGLLGEVLDIHVRVLGQLLQHRLHLLLESPGGARDASATAHSVSEGVVGRGEGRKSSLTRPRG